MNSKINHGFGKVNILTIHNKLVIFILYGNENIMTF